jgi:hypothetical protein
MRLCSRFNSDSQVLVELPATSSATSLGMYQNKNTGRLASISDRTSLRIGAGEEGQCEEKTGEDKDE